MERWFELSQGQYNDLRGEVRRVAENVSLLDTRVSGIEESLRSFRDWVTLQFADLRVAIQSLTTRVERLEHRQHGPIG